MKQLTAEERKELEFRRRLKNEFPFYAEKILRIRTKTGQLLPFKLNRSQRYVDEKIQDQINRTGRARKIILKGRQTGISTYLDGRAYHKVSHCKGVRAFILAHEEAASQNLFEMAQRFHEHCPIQVKPSTGASNAKELLFDILDSGFKVATAGNKAVGRSSTIQYFHGSEVAYWPNADDHLKGIMQAIADAEGTEAYLESTANGIGNVFYNTWKMAEAGDSDFEGIFIPWYWHEEYTRPIPDSAWQAPEEWLEYQEYHRLTPEQLFWAYRKNIDLLSDAKEGVDGGKISLQFKQEYPGTAAEAFETSGANAFIDSMLVAKARRAEVQGYGPIILGVDPARGGKDKTGMIDRQGRKMGGHVCKIVDYGENLMSIVHAVKVEIQRLLPLGLKKVCIDITGLGAGVYDRLTEIVPNPQTLLEPVNFGEKALDPEKYANRRAEMWDLKRQWYHDKAGVNVPDNDKFHGDETAPIRATNATHFRSNGQLVLESKDKIKERLNFSPDLGDAAALTFAPDMDLLFAPKRMSSRYVRDDLDTSSAWTA